MTGLPPEFLKITPFLVHVLYELEMAIQHNCLPGVAEKILEKLSYDNRSPGRGKYRSMSSFLQTFLLYI